jgi:hypothetical protein
MPLLKRRAHLTLGKDILPRDFRTTPRHAWAEKWAPGDRSRRGRQRPATGHGLVFRQVPVPHQSWWPSLDSPVG